MSPTSSGVRRRTAMHGARPHGLRHRMIQIHDVKQQRSAPPGSRSMVWTSDRCRPGFAFTPRGMGRAIACAIAKPIATSLMGFATRSTHPAFPRTAREWSAARALVRIAAPAALPVSAPHARGKRGSTGTPCEGVPRASDVGARALAALHRGDLSAGDKPAGAAPRSALDAFRKTPSVEPGWLGLKHRYANKSRTTVSKNEKSSGDQTSAPPACLSTNENAAGLPRRRRCRGSPLRQNYRSRSSR